MCVRRTDAVARYFPHSPQSIDETMLGRNGRAQLHYAPCGSMLVTSPRFTEPICKAVLHNYFMLSTKHPFDEFLGVLQRSGIDVSDFACHDAAEVTAVVRFLSPALTMLNTFQLLAVEKRWADTLTGVASGPSPPRIWRKFLWELDKLGQVSPHDVAAGGPSQSVLAALPSRFTPLARLTILHLWSRFAASMTHGLGTLVLPGAPQTDSAQLSQGALSQFVADLGNFLRLACRECLGPPWAGIIRDMLASHFDDVRPDFDVTTDWREPKYAVYVLCQSTPSAAVEVERPSSQRL